MPKWCANPAESTDFEIAEPYNLRWRLESRYYADAIEEAAALFESWSQNHPFLDGTSERG
jgi:prophage maintenance system killer protein